jgi:hypothetical protein
MLHHHAKGNQALRQFMIFLITTGSGCSCRRPRLEFHPVTCATKHPADSSEQQIVKHLGMYRTPLKQTANSRCVQHMSPCCATATLTHTEV